MPWHTVNNHAECTDGKPWAVVKDSTGEVEGCHASEADAQEQVKALYANENASSDSDLVAAAQTRGDPDEDEDEDDGRKKPSVYASDVPAGMRRMPDGSLWSEEKFNAERAWEGVLVVEGTPTGDGREFSPAALSWVDGALLRWQKEGSHGGSHDVTVSVGRIDETWRDGDMVRGRGVVDLLNPDGFEVYRRMKDNFAGGISIDADDILDADIEFVWAEDPEDEVVEDGGDIIKMLFGRPEKTIYHGGRIRAATLCDIPAFVEARIGLSVSQVPEIVAASAQSGASPIHQTETSDETWNSRDQLKRARVGTSRDAYAWCGETSRLLLHHELTDDGQLGPANLTACATGIAQLCGIGQGSAEVVNAIPLSEREEAYAHLAAHLRDADQEPFPYAVAPTPEQLVASVAAIDEWRPSSAWFDDPNLKVWVPITVTDQGRVYGHAARWGECHIGFDDMCVTPPFEDAHPYFMTGEVVCADGSRVAVGQITLGTGHAPLGYRASRAAEHYDNTGCAVADVVVGNDDVGIWVAGAVRPSVSAARVHELRASGQVSGDWRRIGGTLRLVGLLAVNVPGFPVPRLQARVASGVPTTLIAAGMTSANVEPIAREPQRSDEELDQIAMRRVMNILARRVHTSSEIEGAH